MSTLFQRQESNVNPICIFNLLSTSIQKLECDFKRWFNQHLSNIVLPVGKHFHEVLPSRGDIIRERRS